MSANIIAAHEGQTVHNSLIDAIVAQEIRRQNDARLAEALAGKKEAEDEVQLMKRAYREYWQGKIIDARDQYARNPDPGPAARAALVAWALVALGFDALFRAVGIGGRP
jgi:hypothetical protein